MPVGKFAVIRSFPASRIALFGVGLPVVDRLTPSFLFRPGQQIGCWDCATRRHARLVGGGPIPWGIRSLPYR